MARGRRPGQRAHKSGQRWHVGVRWSGLLGALLAVVTAAPLAVAGSRGPDPAPDAFVTRSGSRLTLAGRPYHFLGFNAYQLTAQAAGENDDGWPGDGGVVAAGRARVEQLLGLAARLGLRVVRTWAFNHRLPALNPAWLQHEKPYDSGSSSSNSSSSSSTTSYLAGCLTDTNGGSACAAGLPLVWDEAEFVGLDWVVARAEAAGVRLVLALGNLWPAYVGPERFLRAAQLLSPPGATAGGGAADAAPTATGLSGRALVSADADALQRAAGGPTSVADFYCHPGARRLYAEHIRRVTGRVNTFTGRRYSDTPAIMMWDVMNEPRCPGCTPDQLSCYSQWMRLMSDTAAAAAPRQLRAMGTEGFFSEAPHSELAAAAGVSQPLEAHNPGVGSVCEGEDWVSATQLPGIDVGILHTYWRQTEGVPDCGWARMTWWQYLPWYLHYTAVHVRLAGALGRPLVQEEFNIISSRFMPQQRSQLFAAALWQLVSSAEAGGPFAGALWWGAALVGAGWDDGYTLFLDAGGAAAGPTPGLGASLFTLSGLNALLADPASPSAQAAAAMQQAIAEHPPSACDPVPGAPPGGGGGNASTSSVVVKRDDGGVEVVVAASAVKVTAAAGPPASSAAASTNTNKSPVGSVTAQLASTTAETAAADVAAKADVTPGTPAAVTVLSPSISYQVYSSSSRSISSNSSRDAGGGHAGASSPRRLLRQLAAAADTQHARGVRDGGGGAPPSATRSGRRGRALQQVEVLDAFRRGGPRQQCAEARASAGRQPASPPALGSDPVGTLTPPLPQLAALLAAAEGRQLLEVIAAAAERINALSSG
ncbi:hypothetical protein CHLRE_02g141600v5 [Chlamydomonas reinhardtii]|uniref:mannan endo-1,4-beta-mannosidase n=1 Tax=Chlamydomonas reinhardtii TaxID=3055 RepID=A0A2K3E452_CHLRE|nr:uncharacterized protein CHLRE_02g141600v5 [Chlamydomonas reinhardtii]PNW87553.1 hypothetical protein CHLRE_02g141600v5 [Chlamydomonas reinhardtii]